MNCKAIDNVIKTLKQNNFIDDKFNIIGDTAIVFPYIDAINDFGKQNFKVVEDLVYTKTIPARLGKNATVKTMFNNEVGEQIDNYKPNIDFESRENANQTTNNIQSNTNELQAPITDNFLDLVKYKKSQLEQIEKDIKRLKKLKQSAETRKTLDTKYKERRLLETQINELTDPSNTVEFMYNAVFTQLEDIRNSIKNEALDFDKVDDELKFLDEFITGNNTEEDGFSIFKILRDDYKRETRVNAEGKEYDYNRGYQSLELLLKNTKEELKGYKDKTIERVISGPRIEKILEHLNSREVVNKRGVIEANPDYEKARELMDKEIDDVLTEEDIKVHSKDISFFSKMLLGIDDSTSGGGAVLATQLVKEQLTTTQNYYKNFVANISEKLTELNKKVKDTNFLFKKDELGKKTLYLTSLYSNKWSDYKKNLHKSFNKFYFESNWKIKKTQYQKIARDLKNNAELINPAKLLHFKTLMQSNSNYSSRYEQYFTYSETEMKAYENELKSMLGPMYNMHIKQLEDTLNTLDEKINEFEARGTYAEQNIYKNNIWEYVKNLESFSGEVTSRMPVGFSSTSSEMLFENFKSLPIIPKAKISGVDTGYYDDNFKDSMKDPNKFALWQEFSKLCEFISEEYSDGHMGDENVMIPFIAESFKSSAANLKNIKGLSQEVLADIQEVFSKDTTVNTKDESFIRTNYINEAQSRIKKRANLYQSQGMTRDAAYKRAETDIMSDLKEDTTVRDIIAVANLAAQQAARKAVLPQAKLLALNLKNDAKMTGNLYSKYNGWFRQNILNTSIEEINSKNILNKSIGDKKILSLEEKRLKREYKRLKELNKLGNTNKVKIKKTIGNEKFDFSYDYLLDENGKEVLIYKIGDKVVSFEEYQQEFDRYLDAEINSLGISLNAMGVINGYMKIQVYAALGFNTISAMFNRTEGIHTNSLIDATGEYWTPGNDIKSKKTLQFANAGDLLGKYNKFQPKEQRDTIRQFKKLLEHFSSIQDKRNELEKASDVVEMSFSIKNFNFGKMLMAWSQEKPEFKNQGQVILNMLQDLTVNIDGEIVQFFDGHKFNGLIENSDGTISLHPDFQEEYESLSSEKMLQEYSTIATVLNRTHGNYDANDTLLYKGTLHGRAAMQYKGWLGAHVMQRYTANQTEGQLNIDLATGKLRQDGRHIKFLKNHPWLAGFNMMASMGSTWGGIALLGAIGLSAGGLAMGSVALAPAIWMWYQAHKSNKKLFDIELKDAANLAIYVREVLLNSLNYIPRTVFSKDLLGYAESKSNKLKNRSFNDLSADDIRNLQTMAQELSIQIAIIAMKMSIYTLAKALFDTDDEDEKSISNVTHNFVQNQLSRLASSIGSWSALPVVGPFTDNSKISIIRDLERFINLTQSDKTTLGDYIAFGSKSLLGVPTHITKFMDKGLLPWQDEFNFDKRSLNKNYKWIHDNFYLDDEDRAKKKVENIKDEKRNEFKDIILEEFENREAVEVVLKGLMRETIGNKDKDMTYEETLEILENEGVLDTRDSREYISNKLSEQGMSNQEIQERMERIYSKINR